MGLAHLQAGHGALLELSLSDSARYVPRVSPRRSGRASRASVLGAGRPVGAADARAIVGGVVGMTLVGTSASCLNWSFDGGLSSVIASWVLSPALAGVFGVAIYFSTRRLTVLTASPLLCAIICRAASVQQPPGHRLVRADIRAAASDLS